MEILEMLEKNGKELYPEDLDVFETELATGSGYNAAYKARCMTLIRHLRLWFKSGTDETEKPPEPQPKGAAAGGVTVRLEDLAPEGSNPAAESLTPAQRVFRDVAELRTQDGYKTAFKKYAAGAAEIDDRFLDQHYAFFRQWELDAIISVKQMPEEFLEKYFGALDHDKIARYQQFSEGFFMKHFAQMDAAIVLEHGKNPWRKKENRSKQLDVFLRLKGIR